MFKELSLSVMLKTVCCELIKRKNQKFKYAMGSVSAIGYNRMESISISSIGKSRIGVSLDNRYCYSNNIIVVIFF